MLSDGEREWSSVLGPVCHQQDEDLIASARNGGERGERPDQKKEGEFGAGKKTRQLQDRCLGFGKCLIWGTYRMRLTLTKLNLEID